MIILTIEIGVREAFGMLALRSMIRHGGRECYVIPRFVLPRIASTLTNAVVVIDGARDVRGRKKLLTRLRNNNNIICLFDTEGFALRCDKLLLRYPKENVELIDHILTWGKKTHRSLGDMGFEEKLVAFGNPQFAFFSDSKNRKQFEIQKNYTLVNTAFPAADPVSTSIVLTDERILDAKETRDKLLTYVHNRFNLDEVMFRIHPNEKTQFYEKQELSISDNQARSSFEDILMAKEVIGVNCTTLVEARIVNRKATNIQIETLRHHDIEAVCHNIDINGEVLSNPRLPVSEIIFSHEQGYDLAHQANILMQLDHFNNRSSIILRMLMWILSFFLRYAHPREAKKYNYSYVKRVSKIIGH